MLKKKKFNTNIDVVPRNKHYILNLKPKGEFNIHINKKKVKGFFAKHNVGVGVVALVVILLCIVGYAPFIKAEHVVFHPSTCLGGWNNSAGAEGELSVKEGGVPADFNSENSAVLSNSLAQIFCGGFKGEIPKDTKPKKLSLKLSWAYKPGIEKKEDEPVTFLDYFIKKALAQTEGESVIAPEPQQEPKPEQEPAQEAISEPEPEPETLQDTTLPEEASSTDELKESTSEEKASTTDEVIIEPVPEKEGVVEVLYTIDGQNWKSLGKVTRAEMEIVEFEIPTADFSGWESMEKFAVSIQSVASFDDPFSIYLDGIKLEVEYEDAEQMPVKEFFFSNIANSGEDLFVVSKSDETNDEKLLLSSKDDELGGVAIFNAHKGSPLLTTYVEGFSYTLAASYFGAGEFVVVKTEDPNLCATISLNNCESEYAVATSTFSVQKNGIVSSNE